MENFVSLYFIGLQFAGSIALVESEGHLCFEYLSELMHNDDQIRACHSIISQPFSECGVLS